MSRKQQLSIATLLAFAFFIGSTIAVPLPTSPVTNLVFGSCNAHNRDQSIWKSIINANPDIFVWLGDVVYADTMKIPLIGQATPIPEMRAKFDAQKNSPLYSQLRSKTPIVGVWDDHDFGKNNGGAEYHDRVPSQQVFLDFVDEPADSPRRNQTGVYASYKLPGSKGKEDINLILLDVRYHKHGSMGEGDMLGEEQWKWLEKTLSTSKSRFHIIGSGIQITPFQKPVQESWSSHPHSRQRLFDLFAKHRVPGVILLSGDVHYSEVLKVPTNCSGTGYPVYEFTSSGLTHSCDGLLGGCQFVLKNFFTTPYHHDNSFFSKLNWGSLKFDWEAESLSLQTHGVNGDIVRETKIPFSEIDTVPRDHNPSKAYGSLTRCDGPPNWFLLIPFESWKYVLFLIPLGLLAFIMVIVVTLCKCIVRILSPSKMNTKAKTRKLD